MAGSLLLGPVSFRAFEIPERISWGGTQRLTIHELPGGRRVIDAMGRADAPITWEGVFSGEDAAMRARLLDLMRAEGGVWPLTWGRFFYSVVLQAFTAEYERASWIPYRIVCTVLRDEVEGLADDALTVVEAVGVDLSMADQIGSGVDFAPARRALAATDAGRLGTSTYRVTRSLLGTAQGIVEAAVDTAERDTGAAEIVDAAGLAAAGEITGTLARGAAARGYIRRALVTFGNADS